MLVLILIPNSIMVSLVPLLAESRRGQAPTRSSEVWDPGDADVYRDQGGAEGRGGQCNVSGFLSIVPINTQIYRRQWRKADGRTRYFYLECMFDPRFCFGLGGIR